MRFLFSFNYPFSSFGYGGGHQFVRGLSRQLAREGHEVHVCCAGRDELKLATVDAPVKFHFSGSHSRWSWLRTALQTINLARRIRPDWVCCVTSEAVLVVPVCNVLKIPAILCLASPDLPSFRFEGLQTIRKLRYRWRNFLQYLGAKRARLVVTISDHSTRQARENWHIPGRKLANIGHGVEEVFFHSTGTRASEAVEEADEGLPRFLSIGRITLPQKPLDLMAEALATLPVPWHSWTIVGTGEDDEAFKVSLKELGLLDQIVFLGTQDSARIAVLQQGHSLVLLPSRYESFMITVYEAAAQGKVIVTNDVADVRAYFTECPSVVVAESASPDAYRTAILHALGNIHRLSAHARATASKVRQDYNWETVTARFLEALRRGQDAPGK